MRELIDLIRVIVWPVVLAGALLTFYGPIVEFLKELGKRATKLSAFHVELQLASLVEAPPALSNEIRELTPDQINDSSTGALFEHLKGNDIDYVVIDVGDGAQWLTSRLFIFAVMLDRFRSLRSFVFTGESGVFLGTAKPDKVRWALAQRCSWFESALADAYRDAWALPSPPPSITSASGALPIGTAKHIVKSFLEKIQATTVQPGYVQLKGDVLRWEHADWIKQGSLNTCLAGILQHSWVESSPHRLRSETSAAVLRAKGAFVALVGPNQQFAGLIDRLAVLEQLAAARD